MQPKFSSQAPPPQSAEDTHAQTGQADAARTGQGQAGEGQAGEAQTDEAKADEARAVEGQAIEGQQAIEEQAEHIVTDLPVLYADEVLAVIDKPAGLMVHDSALARGETDFVADRLREQFGRPIFLVHRLDRATSGCLLLAFDRETASALGKVLMSREVEKDYWAICRGWPAQDAFEVDHDLDGGPGKPLKKPAQTHFQVLARTELALPSSGFETSRYALLRAQPQTGRFRQIRRHLKHLSHHLIGDTSHGDGRHNRSFRMMGIHRMLLHARRLAFVHPRSGERMQVIAPVDAEFAKALALFGDVELGDGSF